MNKVIFFAAIFAAPMAMACPDLAGNYTCQNDGQAQRVVVSQSMNAGVTSYRIEAEGSAPAEMLADGVERPAPWMDAEGLQGGMASAACEGDARLVINAKGDLMDSGRPVGKLQLTIKASRDASGNLAQNINGLITGDFGEYPIDNQDVTCARD